MVQHFNIKTTYLQLIYATDLLQLYLNKIRIYIHKIVSILIININKNKLFCTFITNIILKSNQNHRYYLNNIQSF